MQRLGIATLGLFALALSAAGCTSGGGSANLETFNDSASYALGQGMGETIYSGDIPVNRELIVQGLYDAIDGKGQFARADLVPMITRLRNDARQAQIEGQGSDNLAAGQAYLAENGAREGVITTASGLQYEVLEAGDGPQPSATDRVRVHYHGTLIDGTVFDSSVERDEPMAFRLNQVIPGWTEGVQLMPVGSKYRFVIPADLAYGQGGSGPIGPNSTLVFEVELLDIE